VSCAKNRKEKKKGFALGRRILKKKKERNTATKEALESTGERVVGGLPKGRRRVRQPPGGKGGKKNAWSGIKKSI